MGSLINKVINFYASSLKMAQVTKQTIEIKVILDR